uniref:hypothetical protein n=3 Tax=Pseudomonas aeruginosa TaxID=287 RepID=UPI0011611EFA
EQVSGSAWAECPNGVESADLGDRAAIDIVTPGNLGMVVRVIAGTQQQPNRPGPDSSVQGIPEETRQRIQRLLNDAAMLESA